MSPFQTKVNSLQAPGVEGDFASANPRAVALTVPGGFVSGPQGAVVGRFAWIDTDGMTVNTYGTDSTTPDGLIHREQQALITEFLGEATLVVPQGFALTVMRAGDFWLKNLGPSAMAKGTTIYAGYADGGAYTAAPTGSSSTGSLGSTNTAAIGSTFTASAGTNPLELVVTAVTGLISANDLLAGTGITPGTAVVSQVSGTTGGAGTYLLNQINTTAAATVTSYGDVLDVSATTGLISIGETVSGGSGFPVGATVESQLSGTAGGAGLYQLSAQATNYVASASGVTTFGNTIKITAVASGVVSLGQPISGTGIPASAAVASQVSGTTGGIGVYTITVPGTAYAASTTLTGAGGIATIWKAETPAAVGELTKASTYGQ